MTRCRPGQRTRCAGRWHASSKSERRTVRLVESRQRMKRRLGSRCWFCGWRPWSLIEKDRIFEEIEMQWKAWMIEREDSDIGISYLTWSGNGPEWTADPLRGLHFVRQEDAERISDYLQEPVSVKEHIFG